MAVSVLSGGFNNTLIWGVQVNSGATGYDIITMASGLPVIVPTPTAALAEIAMNAILESNVARQEDGTCEITLTQNNDDEALQSFLEHFALPSSDSTGTVTEYTYEDGLKGGGDNATGRYVLIMNIGAVPAGATNTSKRKVTIAIGSISPTSGSYVQKSGETSNPTFVFKSIKSAYAYDLTPAMFPATAFKTVVGNTTLPKGSGAITKFLTKNQVV